MELKELPWLSARRFVVVPRYGLSGIHRLMFMHVLLVFGDETTYQLLCAVCEDGDEK